MPVSVAHPGIYIQELPDGGSGIEAAPTSIALMVGWSPRGSVTDAVRVSSWPDYEREFGGLDPRSDLGYAVRQFFENGGHDAFVLRVVDPATATTARCALGAHLTVEASSPGAWANRYAVQTTRRSADPTRFRLEVLDLLASGAVVERFDNLSLAADDAHAPGHDVNAHSLLIRVTSSVSATAPADQTAFLGNLTAHGASTPPVVAATQAGDDGTALGPADALFLAEVQACFGAGGRGDRLDQFNLLCVPGLADVPTLQALQTVARRRRAFLLIDGDRQGTVASMVERGTQGLTGDDAPNSALYWPWVLAPDPLRPGAVREVPPCGFVAGIIARTDATRGMWKGPAGTEASLVGAAGLARTLTDEQNDRLNPLAINCLRTFPTLGPVVWGARTLDGQDERASVWKYLPVRRLAIFLEESLHRGTLWAVFEPNAEPLWAQLQLHVEGFLHGLWRQGAFQGASPGDAYFVRCGHSTTTPNDRDAGFVNILVGFAPLKPREFVLLTIAQRASAPSI